MVKAVAPTHPVMELTLDNLVKQNKRNRRKKNKLKFAKKNPYVDNVLTPKNVRKPKWTESEKAEWAAMSKAQVKVHYHRILFSKKTPSPLKFPNLQIEPQERVFVL